MRWRRGEVGAASTVVLATLAAIVVVLCIWTLATRPASRPRAPRTPPAAVVPPSSSAEPAFRDVTAEVGIDFVHDNGAEGNYHLAEIMSAGGAFLDYDGDGDLDVFLLQSASLETDGSKTSRLYRNDGGKGFVDVTEASGTGLGGYGMGCAAADIDRDGDVDLYVSRFGPDALLVNDGDGTFHEGTREAGLGDTGYGSSVAFLDYDRDGWPDLFVTRYIRWNPGLETVCNEFAVGRDYCTPKAYPQVGDLLYRNRGNGTFEDVTAAAGIDLATGYGLAVLCSDLDGDGWVDVYVANDQSSAHFWRNMADGTFRETGLQQGCAVNADGSAIAGMGTAAEDFDDDGDLDLFVTNIRPFSNVFFRNDGGYFTDVSYEWGDPAWLQPYTGFGVAALDQDLDGVMELFVTNGAVGKIQSGPLPDNLYAEPNQFVRRDTTGRFVDAASELPADVAFPAVSRGLAYGDYDNDGDVDLLVCRNDAAPQLLRNEQHSGNHWLTVSPVDREGIGPVLNARVTVEAGGRRWLREVRPHQSYLASSDPRVNFGLGPYGTVDRIVVEWPDGGSETWGRTQADRHVVLRRGEGT